MTVIGHDHKYVELHMVMVLRDGAPTIMGNLPYRIEHHLLCSYAPEILMTLRRAERHKIRAWLRVIIACISNRAPDMNHRGFH